MSFDLFGNQGAASGFANAYNISASTVIKATPGRVVRVAVQGAGTGTVNDTNTVAGAVAGNQIFALPAGAAVYYLDWPCTSGITYIPTGQTASFSYV
jgi:hypothetical protein